MKLPSWNEFNKQIATFQKLSQMKHNALQDYGELLEYSHSASLRIFSEPIFSVTLDLYLSSNEPSKDKIAEVTAYLQQIEAGGERHYENMSKELNNVLKDLPYSSFNRNIESDKNWIGKIREIMLPANGGDVSSRVKDLREEIRKIIERDEKDVNVAFKASQVLVTLKGVEKAFELSSKLSKSLESGVLETDDRNEARRLDQSTDQRIQAQTVDDQIQLKIGDNLIETIEKNNLANLTEADRNALHTYEQIMLNYHERLLNIEEEISKAVDADARGQYRLKIKGINKDMCDQLEKINKILKDSGVNPNQLSRQFKSIVSLCDSVKT